MLEYTLTIKNGCQRCGKGTRMSRSEGTIQICLG
jgi:hypothetical protein